MKLTLRELRVRVQDEHDAVPPVGGAALAWPARLRALRRDKAFRDGAWTNMAENFSQLKRSLDGTHHHVSGEHLHRYLTEFDFKYSTRKLTDAQRVDRMLAGVKGRRLSYRPLVAHRG